MNDANLFLILSLYHFYLLSRAAPELISIKETDIFQPFRA